MVELNFLDINFYEFIEKNKYLNPKELRLKYASSPDRDLLFFAIDQIEARRKTSHKLSYFLEHSEFLFPNILSAEQSSHQTVATYNASLLKGASSVIDLTAGLGIDSLSFARVANNVTSIEQDQFKCKILLHNRNMLKINNLNVINGDCIQTLNQFDTIYDVGFIDPARRDETGGRVYSLSDSQPDILSNWDQIKNKTKRLMIKASPMLDLNDTVRRIKEVSAIHIVSVKGECKEILIDCIFEDLDKDNEDCIPVYVTDLRDDLNTNEELIPHSLFKYNIDYKGNALYKPLSYCEKTEDLAGKTLLIPHAGVLKSGAWQQLADSFPGIIKLSPNTHLFITDKYPEGFPGRGVIIQKDLSSKELKKLKGKKLNVVCRNYPLTAPQLAQKIGIKDGDDGYLIGCKISKEERPKTLLCEKSI